jgi:AraC-like DNA-binding protein
MPKKLVLKRLDDGFPATVARHHLTNEVVTHFHEGTEMVVVHEGLAVHEVNGVSHSIRKGDVYMIGPGCSHGFKKLQDLVVYNLSFDPHLLDLFSQDLATLPGYQALFVITPRSNQNSPFSCHLRLTTSELSRLEGIIEKIAMQLKTKQPGFSALVKSYLGEIVTRLSQQYARKDRTEEATPFLPIAQAASFMEGHFSEKIKLETLYRASGLSERHFTRLFKECFGISSIDYLLDVRLSKAANLLRQTEQFITDIALSVGFNDSNYFARMFKKKFGVTPKTFRENRSAINSP